MQQYPTDRIRNVALVGHGGVGKTTLAEALLHRAGVTTRAGTIEDGNTITDTEPEEIARRMSISLAIAPFEWQATDGITYKINLIDTPGYPDFVADVDAALSVADLAVIVTSAVDGIEVGTESAWRRCAALGLPRMIFVTREDKHRADFHAVLDQLRRVFGHGCAPLELPLGEEDAFHGVADVLTEQALEYDPDGRHRAEPLPSDIADEERRLHDELVEEIVSGDDEQLEKYLTGEIPTIAELERTLAQEVLECREFPVLLGSGHTGIGVDRLADFICELGPSPELRPSKVTAGGNEIEVSADPNAEPLAYVFKTVADQYVGQISLFKVLSGTIRNDDHLVEVASGTDERMHGLFHLRGSEHMDASRLIAGDIGGVSKLASATTGSTLAPKGKPVRVKPVELPSAGYGVALKPLTQSDDDKLSGALQRLVFEDPALVVGFHDETHQTVLRGVGDIHVAVALARLERKFGVHVSTEEIRVAYRETILASGQAEGKVKKQSGGHGQYAVAYLRVAPLGRGDGFQFVDAVVGGAIPKNYIAAVNKGVEEAAATGGAHGFPVVDVRVECYDGKTHSVDSSDMAFKTAAAQGFREAVTNASPVILEPISLLTVTVPTDLQGDVLSDVSTRRGRIVGSDVDGDGHQIITAHVPTAELQRYAMDLRAMTGGRGTFWSHHDHYDVLPSHLVPSVRKAAAAS
ncbi:MAG TPA: elongation factor G [Ilumatobacteraceae bacterium]|nr:elongation factor G [Ilumatobacteraceae bacterium]